MFSNRMLNRDTETSRITALRIPTMGVYILNMYLTQTTTNENTSTNDN